MADRIDKRLGALSHLCPEVEAVVVVSDENRRYLSGFSGSSGAVVVHEGRGDLITDSRYWEQAANEAPGLTLVRQNQPLWQAVADRIRVAGYQRVGVDVDQLTVSAWNWLKSSLPEVTWVGLNGPTERLRIIKDPEEITLLRTAADIAGQALAQTLAVIAVGVEEHEIAIELEWRMRKLGSDGLSFDTIVASGPRSSLPHGRPTRRPIQSGDFITIDFGATVQGYHSDETVTVACGEVSPEAKSVFDVVCLAQSLAMACVGPGSMASEIDTKARSTIEAAGFGTYFGHATGHGVGLEVHEAPAVASHPSLDRRLEPGMVITVEPGIYLPGRFGVRLEDTLVVTAVGQERLTTIDKALRVL